LWNVEDNIKCIIDNKSVVWGGLIHEELNKYKFIFVNIILLYAGKSCIVKNVIEYMFSFCIKHVKKSIMIRLSAENKSRNYSNYYLNYNRIPHLTQWDGVFNDFNNRNTPSQCDGVLNLFPSIQRIAGNNSSKDLNFSQRLESGDFIYPYLVGLIEGDGWFSVSKKGKYIMYEFGIEVSIRDIQLIYKIKKLLGVGTVYIRNKSDSNNKNSEDLNGESSLLSKNVRNNVIFRIRNKSHLKSIIIPIFDKFPMFTNKQYDYIRFRSLLLSNTIYSKELLTYIRPTISSFRPQNIKNILGTELRCTEERDSSIPTASNNLESILSTSYFPAWLVGFIEAESCFSIYKPLDSLSKIASFEISQTNEEVIILAARDFIGLSHKLQVDKTNNYRLKVSSVRAVENVIKFMSRAPIKLQGYKKLQYKIWLKNMKNIPRYSYKINIPNRY